jgi:phage tail-like protein
MPPTVRYDPLTAFCFTLEIDGLFGPKEAFFKSISGLKSETEVVPYREGGLNGHTHQLVGATKWPNLVLKRGFISSPPMGEKLIIWRQHWTSHENKALKRRRGKVTQLDSKMEPVCHWVFLDGWPCRWEGPEFDSSKSELAVETIEIAHSGLFYHSQLAEETE